MEFSIKGIPVRPCHGQRNIPDGEVFSCPVKTSVNGTIQFNTPTLYAGTRFENVRLDFKDGKIVNATSNNTKRLNEILDTDPGARYIGEFSLGFHPYIMNPMCDILFDEKIGGTFHMALGAGYPETGSHNKSSIHWDMICDMRNGGQIWVDDELFYESGRFVLFES